MSEGMEAGKAVLKPGINDNLQSRLVDSSEKRLIRDKASSREESLGCVL
jgi:hypothetical protein